MKKNVQLTFAVLLLFVFAATAQTKWYNPFDNEGDVIQNRAWSDEIGKNYSRLPDRAKDIVRVPVWNLSRNSAGLAIHFHTNAENIEIRYSVTAPFSMHHMPSTGVSGVDLYAIDSDGKERRTTNTYSFGDTITFQFKDLIANSYHKKGFEYRLFLPLYNSVKWLEIGVPEGAEFRFIERLPEKPIVVYGTSIAHGACASRPGMAWTNILSRNLDWPVVNLGFSGNGPLDYEMIDLISEIDASIYLLDGLPNMGKLSSEEVTKRTVYGITKLREKSNTPIIIAEHIGYSNDKMNVASFENVERLNKASRVAYDSLVSMGVSGIYYMDKAMQNVPNDGYVDYIHPNDLGMTVISNEYERNIREILNMPKGNMLTTIPVSQSRELMYYSWKDRFYDIVKAVKTEQPKKVIIGNSIVHYWGGTQEHNNGSISWNKVMKPEGFFNMGFGWDRIENVLWRVYHGMLDGYNADEIVLMIGTNNLGINSDDEIVEGLRNLSEVIKSRQPKATIKMMGLLPRRGQEQRIKELNKKIEGMSISSNLEYSDVGSHLLTKTGEINEEMFSDGLHPNEKGYSRIVKYIAK